MFWKSVQCREWKKRHEKEEKQRKKESERERGWGNADGILNKNKRGRLKKKQTRWREIDERNEGFDGKILHLALSE